MHEEPYRWIEAVDNRRQYLHDQLQHGNPIVAVSYPGGILMLTANRGTPKLYEIYDRIALAGMGHPADLEKLRFQMLDLAHVEGFQRSPSDVTGPRLVKYGLAPIVKEAFEEIFRAPYISKILIAELGEQQAHDRFVRLDYDGGFEESTALAVVGSTAEVQSRMSAYVNARRAELDDSLQSVFNAALFTWSVGSLCQARTGDVHDASAESDVPHAARPLSECPDEHAIQEHLHAVCEETTLECAMLDRAVPGHSKYRPMLREEVQTLLPPALQSTRS